MRLLQIHSKFENNKQYNIQTPRLILCLYFHFKSNFLIQLKCAWLPISPDFLQFTLWKHLKCALESYFSTIKYISFVCSTNESIVYFRRISLFCIEMAKAVRANRFLHAITFNSLLVCVTFMLLAHQSSAVSHFFCPRLRFNLNPNYVIPSNLWIVPPAIVTGNVSQILRANFCRLCRISGVQFLHIVYDVCLHSADIKVL